MKQVLTLICLLSVHLLQGQSRKWIEPASIDTTLALSDIKVTLSPGQAREFNSYLMPQEVLDSLTRGISNSHRLSRAIEQYQIKRFPDRGKRTDEGLFLKLNSGKWLHLITESRTEEVDNVFEYYFEQFGFYSIRVQWGEGNGYQLVNTETGEITHLIGRPFFSPDGSKIISLGNDIEANYSDNGFQLLENSGGKIRLLGTYDPGTWGCENAVWITNDLLLLQNQSIEFKNPGMEYFTFHTQLELISNQK